MAITFKDGVILGMRDPTPREMDFSGMAENMMLMRRG